ncbi:MAG: sialate O-acetylesterase [Kiritimatiellia bacterium]
MMKKRLAFLLVALLSFWSFAEDAIPKLDLFLLIGQSNMAGRGRLTAENRLPADGVWKLDRNNQWVAATEPLHFDKNIAGAGIGMSFARALRETNPDAMIGLIPCAVGGTPLSRWMPGKDLYSNAVCRERVAQKQGVIKGILWHQGESECGSRELRETYAKRLGAMVEALRAELGLSEDVPFLAGELGTFLEKRNPGLMHPVINAQIKSCEESIPAFRCISADGLTPNGDNLHFNTESLRIFGERYAEAFLQLCPPSAQATQAGSPGGR